MLRFLARVDVEAMAMKGVLRIPQSSSITGTSPSDCFVSYLGHSLEVGVLPLCREAGIGQELIQVSIYRNNFHLNPFFKEIFSRKFTHIIICFFLKFTVRRRKRKRKEDIVAIIKKATHSRLFYSFLADAMIYNWHSTIFNRRVDQS